MARKQDRPKRKGHAPAIQAAQPPNYDEATPKFCLHHVHRNHCVEKLPSERRADFALAIEKFASMTWKQIKLANRHGFGSEWIPAAQIRPSVPERFQDQTRFMVLRYSGKLPMVGTRTNDVFHVLWIENWYGDVYPHGS